MRTLLKFSICAIIFTFIGAIIASSTYPTINTSYMRLQKDYEKFVNAHARFIDDPSEETIQRVDLNDDFMFSSRYVLDQQSWLNSFILRKKPILTQKEKNTLEMQVSNAEKLHEQFEQTALKQVYYAENLAPFIRDKKRQKTDYLFITKDRNGTSVTFDERGATFKNTFENSITTHYFFIETGHGTFYLEKMPGYKIESTSQSSITIYMDGTRYHFMAAVKSEEPN